MAILHRECWSENFGFDETILLMWKTRVCLDNYPLSVRSTDYLSCEFVFHKYNRRWIFNKY